MLFPFGLDGSVNHAAGRQLYFICRWSTFVGMIMHLLAVDNAGKIDCQVRSCRLPCYSYGERD